jgi:dihydroxyacetone kinase-like protein
MFREAAETIMGKSQQLSELDMIGDADFGANISSGFEKILVSLSELDDPDIGTILSTAGKVFVFEIGSTIGGLIGSGFQAAGKQLQGKRELNAHEFAKLLETILRTIQQIGGAKLGDKTLLDALIPAVTAANAAAQTGVTNVHRIIETAALAAEQGANNTANMVAKIGRASYLGERSRGTIDPGAMFIYLLLNSMAQGSQTDHVTPEKKANRNSY